MHCRCVEGKFSLSIVFPVYEKEASNHFENFLLQLLMFSNVLFYLVINYVKNKRLFGLGDFSLMSCFMLVGRILPKTSAFIITSGIDL